MSSVKMVFGSILIFTLLLFSVNCGDKKDETNATPSEGEYEVNDETAAEINSPEPAPKELQKLVIKGLYIDMPVEDAFKRAMEIGQEVLFPLIGGWLYNPRLKSITIPDGYDCLKNIEGLKYVPFKSIEFTYFNKLTGVSWTDGGTEDIRPEKFKQDLENKPYNIVVGDIVITIINMKVNALAFPCSVFNACDLKEDSFAQEIINNYNIPKLEPTIDSLGSFTWIYESDFGWKLFVGNKSVWIEKIAAKNEMKFD